jgi:hypothetical protein
MSNEKGAALINTIMDTSFKSWRKRKHGVDNPAPEADRIVPMVAATGMVGMSRQQIGHAVDLDRDVLDELLDGLVQLGLLFVADMEGRRQVYRTRMGLVTRT